MRAAFILILTLCVTSHAEAGLLSNLCRGAAAFFWESKPHHVPRAKLLKLTSSDVSARAPTPSDYRARILENSDYQILRDLPPVDPKELRHLREILEPNTYTISRSSTGEWFISFPEDRRIYLRGSFGARLTAVYERSMAALPQGKTPWSLGAIELRIDLPQNPEQARFHADNGADVIPYGLIDTIEGSSTVFQGTTQNIFRPAPNEAVIVSTNSVTSEGALHAAPADVSPPRIWLRWGFTTWF